MPQPARVALLAETVVGQIAAGEVIERPASAVKELVENALDAQARRIQVEVEGGGRSLIKVTDDGVGMSSTDALLCFKRHATSKLARIDDLDDIRTLGFRGEGLSSVAAVSRLTLTTRRAGDSQGVHVASEGGRPAEPRPAGCSPGTSISARDLFFNTPGRLKFLKSTATEAGHITDVVSRLAHGFPAVHFTLLHDGRVALDFPPRQDRLQRIQQVLGRRAERMQTAVVETSEARVAVCFADVAQTVSSARSLTLLVNRRHVRDRLLLHSVRAGLGDGLESGRYPVGVIDVDVPPAAVDVNVHPQKLEVRFADGARVYEAVRQCVHEAAGVAAARPVAQRARVYQLEQRGDVPGGRASDHQSGDEAIRRFWSGRSRAGATEGGDYGLGAALTGLDGATCGVGGVEYDAPADIRCLGRVMGRVLVCESADQLLLVDELGAWRQVLEQRLHAELRAGAVESRILEGPSLVSLGRDLSEVVGSDQPLLTQLGFDVESFGGDGWVVRGVPEVLLCGPEGDGTIPAGGIIAKDPGEVGGLLLERLARGLLDSASIDCDSRIARAVSVVAAVAAERQAASQDEGRLLAELSRLHAVDALDVRSLLLADTRDAALLGVGWGDLKRCFGGSSSEFDD